MCTKANGVCNMRKKFLATVLAAALALSLAVPAMAAETMTAAEYGLTMTNVTEVKRDATKTATTGTDITSITAQAPCSIEFSKDGLKQMNYYYIRDAKDNYIKFEHEDDPNADFGAQNTTLRSYVTLSEPGVYTFFLRKYVEIGKSDMLETTVTLTILGADGQGTAPTAPAGPAATGGETATFDVFSLSNVSEVKMLAEEDPSMMMVWRTYLFVCPENATLTAPAGEVVLSAIENDGYLGSSRSNYFKFQEGATSTQLPKGYYCISLDAYSKEVKIQGETLSGLDFVDVYMAVGMPVPQMFANAQVISESGGKVEQPSVPTAFAHTQTVALDGKDVSFQTYALKDAKGNETNYVKLRDIASLLNGSAAQFNVTWDGAVNIQTKTTYVPNGTELATPFSGDQPYNVNNSPIKVNGAAADMEAIVLTHKNGGYTYVKLRDLGKALGFNVTWNNSAGKIELDTTKPYSEA